MTIPLKERTKLDSLLARVVSGNFDANDVDGILIKLRPYATQHKVFREIADFVAHADARVKGAAADSMTAFADRFRFFLEYSSTGKTPLDVAQPFPAYVYRLFLSQATQANKKELKDKHRLSIQTLVTKIQNNFQVNKATNTCSLREGKGGVEFLRALSYITSFLYSKPVFNLADFNAEFKQLLEEQKIAVDMGRLERQLDRIGLCIFCLVSGAEITLPEGDPARCCLATDQHFRILKGRQRLPTGEITAAPREFGSLMIHGNITVKASGHEPVKISYPLITSGLNPLEHCDPTLFLTDSLPNEFGDYVVQVINFADDMALSNGFKLIRADQSIAAS